MAAATDFFETIAPLAGLSPRRNSAEHTLIKGASGSFSLVAGEPTENVHLAFPADDDTTVDAFHRGALEAGCRAASPPRERSLHGRDGYAASVLDPDGNTIEIVNRGRAA